MRAETIAIHAGFDADPATHAVAVPIYQTAAYQFDCADHGAALVQSRRRGLPLQPHLQSHRRGAGKARRGRWKAASPALATASGQAALHYAFANVARCTAAISSSTPQLYGTTHTLLAHVLPRQGIDGRFAVR